jgi:biopolymer transport protein ExbB
MSMHIPALLLASVLCTFSLSSHAWWKDEWTTRKKVTLTSASGEVTDVPVLIRLHSGNFDFLSANDDGSDLRLIAADDKTELKFHVEKWDGANQLALIWVKVPKLTSQTEIFLYFGNESAASAADPKGTYDASSAVYHFAEPEGNPQDSGPNGLHAQSSAQRIPASFANGGAGFSGSQSVTLPAVDARNGYSFTVWIKPSSLDGVLFQSDGVTASLEAGIFKVKSDKASVSSRAPLNTGQWQHLGFTISDALRLYINGKPAGEAPGAALPTSGAALGLGFKGEMDEVQVSGLVRSPEWLAAQAAQGPDGKLILLGEEETAEGGAEASHMGIILKSLTVDGWVAIGLLSVMLLIAIWVMYSKAVYINRVDKSNSLFMGRFRELSTDLTVIDKTRGLEKEFEHSSLYRIYHIGAVELTHRFNDTDSAHVDKSLSPQSLDAIRASLDAGLVEEIQRMNKFMVLLTIAISGGPFIGLLGTVMGVMITFAAIAAAGDVNVNAIAPGIAAALAATVAGMGVAIPSLFGYNYLASRIKTIVSRMHIFVDEFVTKLAENYSR